MSESTRPPKVSCLLVTADRPVYCRRTILCYQRQTYDNKELVVVDNGDEPIDHLLAELPPEEVVYKRVRREPNTYIGWLRNLSLEMATGEFVAPHWDDDDWYHPDRLALQLEPLIRGEHDASTLASTLVHVESTEHFDHPFVGSLPDGVPPTIVHRKSDSIRYPDLRRTSDTSYLTAWRKLRHVSLERAFAYLYIRCFHGGNLWEENHFLRRMRNTPRDFVAYLWHRYLRGNLHGHSRFKLDRNAAEAFSQYLEDSRQLGIFDSEVSAEIRERTAPPANAR
ncbi:MAG TPA: glycosyltransferase family A protein [Rhodothermia bacterium]